MILALAGVGVFVTVIIFGVGIKTIIAQHNEMNEKDGE